MEYKCRCCEYSFTSDDEIPYCPACECEKLEEIEEKEIGISIEEFEEHHIHPRFMDNKNGSGQKYRIIKYKHNMVHGNIMNWMWECIREEDKEKTIQYIISKSKEFLEVDNDTKAA